MREDLKVIVASATMDEESFRQFFYDTPALQIPGHIYDVQLEYLDPSNDDFVDQLELDQQKHIALGAGARKKKGKSVLQNRRENLIVYLVERINKEDRMSAGDILIFLPGQEEIDRLGRRIVALEPPSGCARYLVVPCYATLPLQEQKRIFDVAPEGWRKVVLSTNIAESSVTIDGITHVIDSGATKENWYTHFIWSTFNPTPFVLLITLKNIKNNFAIKNISNYSFKNLKHNNFGTKIINVKNQFA